MKKIIVALLVFMCIFNPVNYKDVHADSPQSLLRGKLPIESRMKSSGQVLSRVTDGNLNTYIFMNHAQYENPPSSYVLYDLGDVYTISSIYIQVTHSNRVRLTLMNENRSVLYQTNNPQTVTLSKHIRNVRFVRVETITIGTNLYELDLNGYVDTTPPAVPKNLLVEENPLGALLRWDNVTDEDLDGYYIYVDGVRHNSTPTTSTSYLITDLEEGMRYKFAVSAVDFSGNESGKSNEVEYIQFDISPPAAPTNLHVTAENNRANLSWDAVSDPDLDGYYVYLDDLRISTKTVETTSATILNLKNGQTYDFSVSAFDFSGNESEKVTAKATVRDTIPPDQPRNVSAAPGNQSATILWSANTEPDLAGYFLYKDGQRVNTRPLDAVYYQVTGLENGKPYTFTLTAVDQSGNESLPALVNVTPDLNADNEPPATPGDVTATATESAIAVNWSANDEPDLLGYFVYLDGKRQNYSPISEISYTIQHLIAGKTYRVQVSAIDQAGNESERSEVIEVTAIDTTPPAAPIGVTAKPGDTQVNLQWMASTETDLAGYNVYVDGIKKNLHVIASPRYNVQGLTNGQTYKFSVSAVDLSGNESERSPEVEARPRQQTPDREIEPGPDDLLVTWGPIEDAIGYRLYYNGRMIKEFPADVFEYRITKEDGYNPNTVFHDVKVITVFRDGSTSQPMPDQPDKPGGWGFVAKDIFTNAVWIVANVAGFILLGLVIANAKRIITVIKRAAGRRRERKA